MQVGETAELTIQDFFEIAKNGGTYEIETPDGWVEVGELVLKQQKQCYKLSTQNRIDLLKHSLEGSEDHYVFTADGWQPLGNLTSQKIRTKYGEDDVITNVSIGLHDTYDLEVKHENHRYFSNDIISHNTGKSSYIRGTGEDLGLPVYIFDLSSMSNFEFQEYWNEMKSNTPCIAAFEDVDAVFEGRKNVTGEQGGGLTFDTFLNALSGIEGVNGILKILTTNRIEVLDEALGVPRKDATGISLSTRPGRADRAIELAHPDENCRRKIAARILCDHPFHIEKVVKEGETDTGAQFTDRCSRIALVEYWKDREGKPCEEFPVFTDSGREMDSIEDMRQQLSAVANDNSDRPVKSSFN